MTPEAKARQMIDQKLLQSGWIVQNRDELNLFAGPGVAVREFPTSTGPVDYALFVDGVPVGIVEAKRPEMGERMTEVEAQTNRYASSTFRGPKQGRIRFVYRATDRLIWFTDFEDLQYSSRTVFSFHRPETLRRWLDQPTTVRNTLKTLPPANTVGFRACQIEATAVYVRTMICHLLDDINQHDKAEENRLNNGLYFYSTQQGQ